MHVLCGASEAIRRLELPILFPILTVPSQGGGKAGWSQTFIMEQYLDGPEVDIDLVMSGGEAVYGGVTDNWPTVEP